MTLRFPTQQEATAALSPPLHPVLRMGQSKKLINPHTNISVNHLNCKKYDDNLKTIFGVMWSALKKPCFVDCKIVMFRLRL